MCLPLISSSFVVKLEATSNWKLVHPLTEALPTCCLDGIRTAKWGSEASTFLLGETGRLFVVRVNRRSLERVRSPVGEGEEKVFRRHVAIGDHDLKLFSLKKD